MQPCHKVKPTLSNYPTALGYLKEKSQILNRLLGFLTETSHMSQLASQQEKRNINLSDKRTSLVLDNYYWAQLDKILIRESLDLDMLIQEIEMRRSALSLAAACRIFILMYMNCRLENSFNHVLNAPLSLAERSDTQKSVLMMGEPEAFSPPDLFQALNLLSRYAAQAS